MAEHSAEVHPHVQTMPGSEAFVLQTGGSARRRSIKPEGAAPTITFRVSGVPGHTHNTSAVASVLCDLARKRGFTHDLVDAWGDAPVEMDEAEIGDSDPVIDEDARFDRAIERAVGAITLIPENCHQQIREPTRSIAEIRQLVTPQDKLRTVTYVEEVGGFVNPVTGAVHISDYPDILVDMLGQAQLNAAQQDNNTYTGKLFFTPVSVRTTAAYRNDNGSGEGYNFVVLQPEDGGPVGKLTQGDKADWHGIVPFRWIQAEKRYRSAPFQVALNRTVEVGPKEGEDGADLDDEPYDNIPVDPLEPLTVTFPAMQTTVASNGYCLLINDKVDARTVLLGATSDNGEVFKPEIALTEVTKPGLSTVAKYTWDGPPAYRFVVGGDAALPGPNVLTGGMPYFAMLRSMAAQELASDMRDKFFAHINEGNNINWAAGNNDDLVTTTHKFNQYFTNFRLETRANFPLAGLTRNAHKGSTWYPLVNRMPDVHTCQNNIGFDAGTFIADTGQEVVKMILADQYDVSANGWRDSQIHVTMNEESMQKTFGESGIVPPGIVAQGDAAVANWLENDLVNANEAQQAAAEAVIQNQIAALHQAVADAELAVQNAEQALGLINQGADPLGYLAAQGVLATAQADLLVAIAALDVQGAALEVALAALIKLRIPHFDEWYAARYSYTGKVAFSIECDDNAEVLHPTYLDAFPHNAEGRDVNQKMLMVRQRIDFYTAGAVQGFVYDDAEGVVKHTREPLHTAYYHVLCDTDNTYGDPNTGAGIRANGTIKELFELKGYNDMDDEGAPKEWHLVGISAPQDERKEFHYAFDIIDENAFAAVPQHQAAEDLVRLEKLDGAGVDVNNYQDGQGVINVEAVIQALQNLSQAVVTATYPEFLTMGVGNALEVRSPLAAAVPAGERPVLIQYLEAGNDDATLVFQDLAFGFESPRLFFLSLNNIAHKNLHGIPSVYYFSTSDCVLEARKQTVGIERVHVCTRVTKVYNHNGDVLTADEFKEEFDDGHGHMTDTVCLCQLGPEFQDLWFGKNGTTTVFDAIRKESRKLGPVFRSQKRISQHLCAPVLNPNARLQCSAPLNYETRHLPPELRDFVLRLEDVDWSFLPGTITMEPLTLYEFNGGNQKPAAEDNLLHLPQFRVGSTTDTSEGKFDFEVFSPYGMPSYIAVFARDQDFRKNYLIQPLIKQLNIMCNTTMKKSNTILDADVHQLYHITQRNVHPRAQYDRKDFNKRQVVLLSAEDIGLLGLKPSEYQYEKRAVFRFRGSVDQIAEVTALLIFNNRGLYVHGRQLSVERLVR